MNKNNPQKQYLFFANIAAKITQKPEQSLAIIGLSILLLLGIMFIKVQPEYLQASFFGRFFPATETENSDELNEIENNTDQPLGFYRFNDLQKKYFPIPDTNDLTAAINYDYTPQAFSLTQNQFIALFETTLETMLTSSQHIDEFDEQFKRIQSHLSNTHTDIQPQIIDEMVKFCSSHDASGAPCE